MNGLTVQIYRISKLQLESMENIIEFPIVSTSSGTSFTSPPYTLDVGLATMLRLQGFVITTMDLNEVANNYRLLTLVTQ